MRAVELFAGAGGLALGSARAGFKHEAIIEWDHDCCETLRRNQRNSIPLIQEWPSPAETDARAYDIDQLLQEPDLIAGGPPCQPFSLAGKHKGAADHRDMFPTAASFVRRLRPKAFVFENVKGLLRESFSTYFEYILLQLQYPEYERKYKHTWLEHKTILERHHTGKRNDQGLHYRVLFNLLNAADYGVPQRRERVFIVGFRSDISMAWNFPVATNSFESLLASQWVSHEYWDRHGIAKTNRPACPLRHQAKLDKIRKGEYPYLLKPALTVRDAISSLPDPRESLNGKRFLNHFVVAGARPYPGHTGSSLDEPGKTLKAGDHGVPGGENMIILDDGMLRYLTVREAARLQTFPDDYEFLGSWTECMRQIGNAVPVMLAQRVVGSVANILETCKEIGAKL